MTLLRIPHWHALPKTILDQARRLRADERGSVFMLAGFLIIPLILAAGIAVDASRAYHVRARLSHAIDMAGLAVGSAIGNGEDPQEVMQRFFNANYPADALGVPATPSMTINGNVISITASADLNTTLMRVGGFDKITVSSQTQITRETKGLEVAMVLDVTGSMYGSKISAMQQAARDFVGILFGDNEVHDYLKIGIVPFNGTVNIGTSNRDPYTTGRPDGDYSPDVWGGCVMARSNGRDTIDTDQTDGKWTRLYAPWKYRKNQWPPVNYSSTPSKGPNQHCPPALMPLTNTKQPLLDKIDSLIARGYTHINFGAVWGWRVLSPGEPFTEGAAYGEPDTNKAILIMTDGDNTVTNNYYTAYGYLNMGLLGTTSYSAGRAELNSRLLTVCSNMKAQNIIVYTVSFGSGVSSSTQALLSSCATDADHYFHSPTNAQLQSTFRAIANELSNLRISQ